jgi:hypothetical protein
MLARQGSRASAWVSLFAMLMMFIGPLVSQAMPMDHAMAAPASEPVHAQHGMAMEQPQPHCQPTETRDSNNQLHPLWERCGYCSLFFHCPALPQSLHLRADAAPPATARLLVEARQGHGLQPVFPGARTRAPPAFSRL